jgi:hypothetical protein
LGFKEAKSAVLKALAEGAYTHEARGDIDIKNDLAMGNVTAEQVANVIRRSKGFDHQMSPHHRDSSIVVHTITKDDWYMKFYFIEPDAVFISVHKRN